MTGQPNQPYQQPYQSPQGVYQPPRGGSYGQPAPYGQPTPHGQPGGPWGQYGPGMPYGAPHPPPPARPRRRRRWLIPLLVVVFLLLGGCGIGGWMIFRAVAGPIDAVNDYLADVRDGRYADAYDKLCPSLRSRGTVEEYEAVMLDRESTEGRITSFSATGVDVETQAGSGTTRTVTVDVQRGSTSTREIYSVGREDDKYCLLST